MHEKYPLVCIQSNFQPLPFDGSNPSSKKTINQDSAVKLSWNQSNLYLYKNYIKFFLREVVRLCVVRKPLIQTAMFLVAELPICSEVGSHPETLVLRDTLIPTHLLGFITLSCEVTPVEYRLCK